MPYQSVENEDLYFEKLGYIKTLLDETQCTNFAVIGDWNANLGSSGTMTFREPMFDFCRENNLTISSHIMLPSDSYTHIHMYIGNIYYSWLDHVVSSHDFHQSIRDISICYDTTDEDHIPLSFILCVDNLPATSDTINDISAKIRWDGVSDSNRDIYYFNSSDNLGKIPIPIDTVCCNDIACENQIHRVELDFF